MNLATQIFAFLNSAAGQKVVMNGAAETHQAVEGLIQLVHKQAQEDAAKSKDAQK